MSIEPRDEVRAYVLREFLKGEDPSALLDQTALVSSRLVNSLGLVRMVAFLEKQFDIKIESHEMNAKHLDSVAKIVQLIADKRLANERRRRLAMAR